MPQLGNLYVYVKAAVYLSDSVSDSKLVMTLQSSNGTIYSNTIIPVKDNIPYFGDWEQFDKTLPVPAFKDKNDSLKIYFTATRGKTFIDEEKVMFGVKK